MAAVCIAGSAAAAPLRQSIAHETQLSQSYVSERVSILTRGNARACRIHVPIDVVSAAYHGPDGTALRFEQVTRNAAAGLTITIPEQGASVDGGGPDLARWTLLFKYPLAAATLEIGDEPHDLGVHLDPTGDSVTLPGDLVDAMQAAWRAGTEVAAVGVSSDTGNGVRDILEGPSADDLATCAAWRDAEEDTPALVTRDSGSAPAMAPLFVPATALTQPLRPEAEMPRAGLGEALPPGTVASPPERLGENGLLSLEWGGALPGTPDPTLLRACGMTEMEGELERVLLASAGGFVTPVDEAWLRRNDAGDLVQVYVPGVFDAVRTPGTAAWTADVSVFAFANDPMRRPVHKGCLGTRSVPMALQGNRIFEAPSQPMLLPVAFSPPGEDVPAGDLLPMVLGLLPPDLSPEGAAEDGPSQAAIDRVVSSGTPVSGSSGGGGSGGGGGGFGGGGFGGGGSGGGGGGGSGGTPPGGGGTPPPGGPDPQPPLSAVPLPAPVALLLAGLFGLVLLRRRVGVG